MDIFLISIAVICFCSVNYEVNSQPFLTRKESSTFLETSRVKRSEDGCGESNDCYKCSCHHCPYGKYCQMSSSCNLICVEINECSSNPCRNGGTCHDGRGSYTCSCKAGITGRNCEIDIDECSSNPCQNNATCTDHINYYKCHCTPRIYGVNCDTNICHPTPADVVFVLDSSVSMSESDFRKQLEFVAKFTDNVIIGPRDFQISVITFSYDAHVEFFLNQYADNATLKEAIMNITYKPGATFTDKGLEAVKTVFSPGHGIERRVNGTQADRFVYLLTDGMSNHRQNTIAAAKELKEDCRVTLAAVGIGHMVSHAELVNIASEHDHLLNVYSVNNFNSLYTLLKQLVRYNCDECQLSARSDVAIVIDTSYNVTIEQYKTCIDAVFYLVDLIDLAVDKAHVSVTTFDTAVSDVFGLINNKDKDGIKAEVNRIVPSTEKSKVNIVDVLDSVATNVFSSARADAAKFLIIFSNGYFENVNSLKLQRLKTNFAMQNIEIIAVASGTDVNLEGLMPLVADSFHIFHTKPDKPPTNLDVLQSDFVYSTCDLKNE